MRDYIEQLRQTTTALTVPERARVSYLKMYLNYIAQAVDAEGAFLREMRLAQTESELCSICDRHLLSNPDAPFAAEPYRGLLRQNIDQLARCGEPLAIFAVEGNQATVSL